MLAIKDKVQEVVDRHFVQDTHTIILNMKSPEVPKLLFNPKCSKCGGYGYVGEYTCARCQGKKRVNGSDIARYWAWHTNGYQQVDMKIQFILPGASDTSERDFKLETIIYMFRDHQWAPMQAQNIVVGDWILVPRNRTHDIMICKVTGLHSNYEARR